MAASAQFVGVVNDPLTFGSGEFLPLEFPLAYWLEQHGYDVTYCSNSDMITPDRGLRCKAFVSVDMMSTGISASIGSVERADAGVNLLFLSGNTICWVTPFRASGDGRPNRIIFRGGPYGATIIMPGDGERAWAVPRAWARRRACDGARNIEPVNGGGDWVIVKPEHWIFAAPGVKKGDRIPGADRLGIPRRPARPAGPGDRRRGTAWVGGVQPQKWTATIYPGPKGNFVFNASTIFWAQGLSSPPGHTLPWSHWSRPHGPDERVHDHP